LRYLYRRTEELRKQFSPEVPNFLALKPFGAYLLKGSWMADGGGGLGGGSGLARVRR